MCPVSWSRGGKVASMRTRVLRTSRASWILSDVPYSQSQRLSSRESLGSLLQGPVFPVLVRERSLVKQEEKYQTLCWDSYWDSRKLCEVPGDDSPLITAF